MVAAALGRALDASEEAHVRGAVTAFGKGQTALALAHFVHAGIGRLADAKGASLRLHAADALMKAGVGPKAICEMIAGQPLRRDYNPDQPRVPAGNGDESGQWTAGSDAAGQTAPKAEARATPTAREARSAPPPILTPLAAAARRSPLFSRIISAITLRGLATLASRLSAVTAIAGVLFVPDSDDSVERGAVAGRDAYRYVWDKQAIWLEFSADIDGKSVPLARGRQHGDAYVDDSGRILARIVGRTLVIDIAALDDARRELTEAGAAPGAHDNVVIGRDEPKLCPAPAKEVDTKPSQAAKDYQLHVTGLPYPLAVFIGGVWFDGCRDPTVTPLEAKADYAQFVGPEGKWYWWWGGEEGLIKQMRRQSDAAAAIGRRPEWHIKEAKALSAFKATARKAGAFSIDFIVDPGP